MQKALGQAKIPIQIGDFIQTVDFLIGNFTDEAIIGITDLQKLRLKADFENIDSLQDLFQLKIIVVYHFPVKFIQSKPLV